MSLKLSDLPRCPQCKSADIIKINDNDIVNHQCQQCGAAFTKEVAPSRSAAPPSEREAATDDLVIAICRETYDRFVMGGWEPKDAHAMIREMLQARAAIPSNSELQAMLDKYAETERILRKRVEELESAAVPQAAASPEELAKDFHDTYERLAPFYGYVTRKESAKPWAEVPEKNRNLMIAVCASILERRRAAAVPAPTREQIEKIITMFRVSDWSDVPDLAVEEVTAILRAGATAPPKEG